MIAVAHGPFADEGSKHSLRQQGRVDGESDSISTAADLVAAYQGRRWRGEIEFEIWRNQMRSAVKVIFR